MDSTSASSVVLQWMCDQCRHNFDTVITQPLVEHVQVGSPMCQRCGDEMELMQDVKIVAS